jgi:hypothetical protein
MRRHHTQTKGEGQADGSFAAPPVFKGISSLHSANAGGSPMKAFILVFVGAMTLCGSAHPGRNEGRVAHVPASGIRWPEVRTVGGRRHDARVRLRVQAWGSTRDADLRAAFAQVAESQFGTCASRRSVPNPVAGKNLERDLRTKAELVKAVADSFAFCDVAFSALTDANVVEYVKVGQGEVVKSAVLTGILAHNSEMYGIATVYLRAKNLVPPSTKHQTQGR